MGLPRSVSGILVIGLTALSVCSVGWIVSGQVYNVALELPQYRENISQKVNALHLESAGRLTATVQMLSDAGRQILNGNTDSGSVPLPAEPGRRRRAKGSVAKTIPPNSGSIADSPVSVRIEEPKASWASVAVNDIHPLIGPTTSAFAVIIFVVFMLLARDDIRDRTVRLMTSTSVMPIKAGMR